MIWLSGEGAEEIFAREIPREVSAYSCLIPEKK